MRPQSRSPWRRPPKLISIVTSLVVAIPSLQAIAVERASDTSPLPAEQQVAAGKKEPDSRLHLESAIWRVKFDNDIFAGSDDAYSAGFGLHYHGPVADRWQDRDRFLLSRWIAKAIPGLDDEGIGGRTVHTTIGLSQITQTPKDISTTELLPEDAPWAGILGLHWTWASLDNDGLNAFQIYVGCMGPCSGAEEVQRYVHEDLGWGEPLKGWDNQLKDELLFNLNYEIRRKVLTPAEDAYASNRWAGDLSIASQVAVGNFFRFADAHLEFRWGWRLPHGFTEIPDPAGRGITLDSTPYSQQQWAFYATVVPRFVYFDHIASLEGGATTNGLVHPGIRYDNSTVQAIIGLHSEWSKMTIHFSYYTYFNEVIEGPNNSSLDWANLSLEFRF